MVTSVCSSQHVLLPALALVLRRHGETLPEHVFSATFQPLLACLRSCMHAGHAACTTLEAQCAIWVVRCLRGLVLLSSKRAATLAADGHMTNHADVADAWAAYPWPEVRSGYSRAQRSLTL